MRAVVSEVGLYDALRWELQPNGAFNVTEFGSVKDPEQFRALYAYSPYHNARDGAAYPAVLFSAGDNDGRVAPYESRKMTARLQAATSTANPILLRTEAAAGHGIGTALSTRIEEQADVYSFLVDQLGMAPLTSGASAVSAPHAPEAAPH
jgi:prolyl oligopeptidase